MADEPTTRRAPAPGELRRTWRLGVLLLIVDRCWGRRATWTQLHLLSWALLVRRGSSDLERQLAGNTTIGEYVVGIDPAVNRTIDLALGEGLIERDGSRVELSPKGEGVLAALRESEALTAEDAILAGLPRKVSNQQAEAALGGAWRR